MKGSLSLNHDDTLRVKEPSARLSHENSGKVVSSRFSSSEKVGRGNVLKTMAKAATTVTMIIKYILLSFMS